MAQTEADLRGRPDAAVAAPELELTAADAAAGQVPRLQALASEAHGPVLRGCVPSGPDAGPCLHLVGPEVAEVALSARVGAFSSAQGWRHVLGSGCGHAVLNTDDALHAQQRRQWAPALSAAAIQAHWPLVTRIITECVRPLRDGADFDAYPLLRALAFRAVARTLAGLPDAVIEPAFRAACTILDGQDYAHEARAAYVERADAARADLAAILRDAVAARRGQRRHEHLTLTDLLLSDGDGMSDEQIRSHLSILLIAGHDTGASLYSRAVFVLAERPPLADAIAHELAASGWDASAPAALLDELPQLQRFLLETVRLYPPLINLPRVVVQPIVVGDYRLEPGTRVAIAVAATHLLSRLYADPLAFDPARFDGVDAARAAQPFQMLGFAGGARMCMGARFARLEFKSIIAQVVSQLHLESAHAGPVAHAGFWNARPAGPLRVRARAR